MNYFDVYLNSQGLTRYKVAMVSDVSSSTLQRPANSSTDRISGKIIKAVAKALDTTPGIVFDELILTEQAIQSFFLSKKAYFRTFGNQSNSYMDMIILESLAEWIEFDDDEREDYENDFVKLVEQYLENEEDDQLFAGE
ncbi:hypothetical protein ACNZ61_003006 [Enterococcus hirae]